LFGDYRLLRGSLPQIFFDLGGTGNGRDRMASFHQFFSQRPGIPLTTAGKRRVRW
jgi:hypothetical protein